MKYNYILLILILLSSCVSQKKYAELEATNQKNLNLLNSATVKLNSCLDEKATAEANSKALQEQIAFLKANNQDLINNMGNLTTLSQKGAENLEKSLESLKEKDLVIRTMQDAVTRRDSVTLALVTSLKGAFIDISDNDIEINVEKGVVFISISDLKGKTIANLNQSLVPDGNTYGPISLNVNNPVKLSPGIYLYNVLAISNDGHEYNNSGKLVIIR